MRIDPFKHSLFRYQSNPEILKQLQELGLSSTGSVEGDLKAIKEAVKKMSLNSPAKGSPPETPAEMAVFMKKLGLKPANSKEKDHCAVIDRLKGMLASARTDEEKQKVNDLVNEFNVLIATLESAQKPGHPHLSNFTGMQQLGNLNKYFIIK